MAISQLQLNTQELLMMETPGFAPGVLLLMLVTWPA
jgi:hypothetical protein